MSKILETLKQLPTGAIAVSAWLQKLGVSPQLVQKYEKTGWLKKIGFGAYVKMDNQPNWLGGVYALQNGLDLKIHPGGRTALELQGKSHFVPMGNLRVLFLYNHGRQSRLNLPKWFTSYFKNHTAILFQARLFETDALGLEDYDAGNFTIKVSSTERAVLEVLALVPVKKVTFEQAALLLEGQVSLRPELLQSLLENCRSQLVVRLCLYFLSYYQLPIFERLDLSHIDIGVGKRVIGNGGVFAPELNLLVPELPQDENPTL